MDLLQGDTSGSFWDTWDTHTCPHHPRGKLATWQGWRSFLSPTSQVELEVEVAGHGCVGPQLKGGGGGTAFEEVGPTTQDQ